MTSLQEHGTKISADVVTGVTVAQVNEFDTLLVTVVTILGRLLVEFVIHKIKKRQ